MIRINTRCGLYHCGLLLYQTVSNRALYTVWIVSMSGGDQFPPQGPLNHHLSDCTRFHSIITLIFIIIVIIILNIEINIWVSSLSYSRQFMTMILFSIQLVLVLQLPWKFLQYSIFFTNHKNHQKAVSLWFLNHGNDHGEDDIHMYL